jgi:DNA-binding GntR family transcriptional regulator
LKRRTDGLYDSARGLTAHQEHLQLIQAMKRRDAAQAVGILRAHIRTGKDNVLADLRQRQHFREVQGLPVLVQ